MMSGGDPSARAPRPALSHFVAAFPHPKQLALLVALSCGLGALGGFMFDKSAILLTTAIAGMASLLGVAARLLTVESSTTTNAGSPAQRRRAPAAPGEERLGSIIRSSTEAIIAVDETQRIVMFNPMAERVFGCPAASAIGTPLSRFIPERFRQAHAAHVEQFGRTGVTDRAMGIQRVLYGMRADGEEFPIEASISQISEPGGKLYTVILRDVTERTRSEQALKQSREELRALSANLQKVREEEKTRIARELHDDLGQQLTALKMDISAIEQILDGQSTENPRLAALLLGMRQLVDATVASVRRIAADLRPVMLDDLGLIPAIEWLAHDFSVRYGIRVDVHVDLSDDNFSSNGATTLFRIVQESLTNVARHAEASLVNIDLRVEAGMILLRIVDNGHGTDLIKSGPTGSLGLVGIRERAHMLGGTVELDSAPGQGFTVLAGIPQRAVQQEKAPT